MKNESEPPDVGCYESRSLCVGTKVCRRNPITTPDQLKPENGDTHESRVCCRIGFNVCLHRRSLRSIPAPVSSYHWRFFLGSSLRNSLETLGRKSLPAAICRTRHFAVNGMRMFSLPPHSFRMNCLRFSRFRFCPRAGVVVSFAIR